MCTEPGHVAGRLPGPLRPGPRLPLLVISPYAKTNYVDHHATEQASITEVHRGQLVHRPDRRRLVRRRAPAAWTHMFDFTQSNNKRVLLKPNGSVKSIKPIHGGHAWRDAGDHQ